MKIENEKKQTVGTPSHSKSEGGSGCLVEREQFHSVIESLTAEGCRFAEIATALFIRFGLEPDIAEKGEGRAIEAIGGAAGKSPTDTRLIGWGVFLNSLVDEV